MKQTLIILPILLLFQCASSLHTRGFMTRFLPANLFQYKGTHYYYSEKGYPSEITIDLNDTSGTIRYKINGKNEKEDLQTLSGRYCLLKDVIPCGTLEDCDTCLHDTLLISCFKGDKSLVYYNFGDACLHCSILDVGNLTWLDFSIEKGKEDIANQKLLLKAR
jgi:hypothetical protein